MAAPLIWHDHRQDVICGVERLLQTDPRLDRAEAASPALLIVSLDALHRVVSCLGRAQAERVVEEVQRALSASLPSGGLVVRGGQDDFSILAGGVGRAGAERLASGIERRIRAIDCGPAAAMLGVNIGIHVAEAGESAADVVTAAEIALGAAQADSRRRVVFFERSMLAAVGIRQRLSADLAAAVRAGALGVVYQPLVNLQSGAVHGVEALARWTHGGLGPIRPDEFLPLADDLGIGGDVDHFVLSTALAQMRAWSGDLDLPSDFAVSVNVAPARLHDLAFVERIRRALDDVGVPPRRLVLELTESAFLAGGDLDAYSLGGLRQLGIGLDIDDFGTGYSSISYLRRLPADRAKIDRSLLGNVDEDEGQRRFLKAVLGLVAEAGLCAVMEGIETAAQAEAVASLGATLGQGFYFSRPLPAEEMTAFLRAGLGPRPA